MKRFPTIHILPLTLMLCACSSGSDTRTLDREAHDQSGHSDETTHTDPERPIVELTSEAATGASLATAPVERVVLSRLLETTGEVGFDEDRLAHVGPRIPGRVEQVLASLGDHVKAQEALARVDSIELGRSKAEYLQARARHQLMLETLQREESLYADRISSEQEVLSARAALREAEATVGTAEETLHLYGLSQDQVDRLKYDDPQASMFSLRAPFAGTVVERHATQGELVEPGTNLFTIADLSQVWVWIDVYERDLARVHRDDDVEVRVDAHPDVVFSGRVTYLANQVEAETRSIRARLDVPNPNGLLRAGMFARIRLSDPHFTEEDSGGPSIVVPESAVQRDGPEFIVFVALDSHRFERRAVTTGRKAERKIEILHGVVPGEEVVVVGAFLLKSEAAKKQMGEGHTH